LACPDRARRTRRGKQSGFALPLALFMLLVIALLAAILLDGAVQELRIARGDVAGSRAQAASGSALADMIAARSDSAVLARPRGAIYSASSGAGAESTTVTMQSLGNGLVRASASSRFWASGVRGEASSMAFVRIVPDSAGPPGTLRYRRLQGWWWAQIP
jgi:Tfp pilus assembly protein PilX